MLGTGAGHGIRVYLAAPDARPSDPPIPHELAVRASDDSGRQQPAERSSQRIDDYEHNAYQTIRVTVR